MDLKAKTMVKRIVFSKKVWVALAGMVAALTAAAGLDLPPDVLAMVMGVIKWIVLGFCGGQGIADGMSKGRTSASRDLYD